MMSHLSYIQITQFELHGLWFCGEKVSIFFNIMMGDLIPPAKEKEYVNISTFGYTRGK